MVNASRKLLATTQRALKMDPVLSVSTLAVLLYVASHPNCAAADIVRDLGLAQPAVTRHLQRLSGGSPGASAAVGKGLDLVTWHDDPADARRRLYNLNEHGTAFVTTLCEDATLLPRATQGQPGQE